MNRRDFVRTLVAVAGGVPGSGQPPAFQTFTYKATGGCEIQADVYGADENATKPVLIYIHGGALIGGSRKTVPRHVPDLLLKMGYVVALIDYRLAPETKLAEIIGDIQDAAHWVRTDGPKLFHIDPGKLAISGDSAGGYLTLMTGFRIQPRPRVLAVFWGYGDITAPWYSKPDAFYLKQPRVTREEAYASVGASCLTTPPVGNRRGRFYLYCRQNGLWPKEIAGHDPDRESDWFENYRPVRNVSREYPPTILVHGTADTDVPYDESKEMAGQLAHAAVEHELITVSGGSHRLSEVPNAEMAMIYSKVARFIRSHLG